jgi:hypothetical protein
VEYVSILGPAGERLAQFIDLDGMMLGWPTVGGFFLYQANPADPRWTPPGNRRTPEGFLQYLAGIAAADKGDGMHCEAERTGGQLYQRVALTRTMSAPALADVTGYDVELVRKFLREHLTFGDA